MRCYTMLEAPERLDINRNLNKPIDLAILNDLANNYQRDLQK